MFRTVRVIAIMGLLSVAMFGPGLRALAHGEVTPQAMITEGLPILGDEWSESNPFRGDAALKDLAIERGSSGYNQNCARCHGLQVLSGGLAPDLRYLEADIDGDEWYIERVRGGAVRDGKVYMPKFEGIISQEGLWAIRSYIDSKPEDD